MGELISEGYKALLQRTHAESPGWGTTAHKTAKHFADWLNPFLTSRKSMTLLDYGCGKGTLLWAGTISQYDPGIKGKDTMPEGPFDVVACVDVLEHVENQFVSAVLDDLCRLAPVIYVVIDTVPAKKVLPDGRNAHLTVREAVWWVAEFDLRGARLLNAVYDGRRYEALYART